MSFARLHKLITYVIAGLGLYALSLGGELAPAIALVVGVAAIGSWFVEGTFIEGAGWIRGWNVAVVSVFALQILRWALFGDGPLALGLEYAAFLQLSRLYNRRTAREHQQIAVLAFLHLIAATVLSTSLTYAFLFFGFVIVTPWMLTLSHLRREIEGNYPGGAGHRGPAVQRVLASRRVVGPRFLLGTALLTLPLFAVTIGFFLLFPRVGMGFLSFGQDSGRRTAGFGSNVELGGFGVIRDDPTVVLRAYDVPDVGDPPAERINLRMRGTSFDRYDGVRWTRSNRGAYSLARMGHQYSIVRAAGPNDPQIRIDLDHLSSPVIFLPDDTVAITIPPRIQGGTPIGRRIFRAPGLDIRYLDDDDLGLSYVAHVSQRGGELGVEELEDEDRAAYLQLPAGTERIAALARRITERATDDRSRAQSIQAWLRDSGEFTYSLEQPDTRGRDPLEVFLFEARSGHCEYYSTAMAVMLRTLGVPTRNVTGFLGGRYNPYGGYYSIRQGDAHSWLEAHVDGRWATYDPTPPARGVVGPTDGWLADLRAMVDAIRTRWNRHVVSYDLRSQAAAMRRFFRFMRALRSDVSAAGDEAAEVARTRDGGPSWPALIGLALVVVLLLLVVRFLRRRRGSGATAAELELRAAVRVYRALEKAMARRGVARPLASTPCEHADRLDRDGFPAADAVRDVTERYMAARFGGESLGPAEIDRLNGRIAEVRRGAPRAG